MEMAVWLRKNVTPMEPPTVSSYTGKHVLERVTGGTSATASSSLPLSSPALPSTYDQPNVLFRTCTQNLGQMN
ncbi:hypothetical protein [Streptomyces sp. NPDC012888]|uniref:hypothetical protein n=1 Tax=Streptomyces sp. NPDC012888 TaxID=3364855 RepID=UPI0036758AAD